MSHREAHVTQPEVVRHEDTRTTVHDLDPCAYTPEYAPFTSEGAKRTYPAPFEKRMDHDGDEATGSTNFDPE